MQFNIAVDVQGYLLYSKPNSDKFEKLDFGNRKFKSVSHYFLELGQGTNLGVLYIAAIGRSNGYIFYIRGIIDSDYNFSKWTRGPWIINVNDKSRDRTILFDSVSIVGSIFTVHICGISKNNRFLYHCMQSIGVSFSPPWYHETWSGFGKMFREQRFKDVSIAWGANPSQNLDMHITATTDQGRLVHTIRYHKDPAWSHEVGDSRNFSANLHELLGIGNSTRVSSIVASTNPNGGISIAYFGRDGHRGTSHGDTTDWENPQPLNNTTVKTFHTRENAKNNCNKIAKYLFEMNAWGLMNLNSALVISSVLVSKSSPGSFDTIPSLISPDALPSIDNAKCNGCGDCVDVCPTNYFKIQNGRAVINNANDCVKCEVCYYACQISAIR